ncbi:MAG: hypothetical protein HXY25_01625 [Alphaproteobacteria bacterium]|nr:hypothetical protein [Alphaproteobacteria bacterium]
MVTTVTTSITDVNHQFTYTNGGSPITQTRVIDVAIHMPDTPGDYPIVIYSHGWNAYPSSGGGANARELADQGYIVITPTHLDSAEMPSYIADDFPNDIDATTLHRVADIQFLLDSVSTLGASLPSGYTMDDTSPTVAGHSQGAFTAALLVGADTERTGLQSVAPGNQYGLTTIEDTRFAATILYSIQANTEPVGGGVSTWHGFTEDAFDDLDLPVLVITGTEDKNGMVPTDRLGAMDDSPSGDKHGLMMQGLTHSQVGGSGTSSAALQAMGDVAGLFLDGYIKGDTSALSSLADVDALEASSSTIAAVYERMGSPYGDSNGDGRAVGTSAADTLNGIGTDDLIEGLGGNDTINGGAGNDVILGGDGADYINGNAGQDDLTGGAGNDRFIFNNVLAGGTTSTTRDRILDFDDSGDDIIDLSGIDANENVAGDQSFSSVGTGAFTAAGQARAIASGSSVLVELNVNSDLAADMVIELVNTTLASVTLSDFIG